MAETITVKKEDYDLLEAGCELLMMIIGDHGDLLEGYRELCPDVVRAAGY